MNFSQHVKGHFISRWLELGLELGIGICFGFSTHIKMQQIVKAHES